jgi:hypothetical protein
MPDLGTVLGSLLVVGLLAIMLAFAFGTQRNISKGNARLTWLQSALPALGHRTTLRWLGSTAVQLELVEPTEPFREITILYVLEPRDVPLVWLFSRASGRRDVLIFRASLKRAPVLDLEATTSTSWIKAGDDAEAAAWPAVAFPGGVRATALRASALGAEASELVAARHAWERLAKASDAVWRLSIRQTVPHLEVHVRPADATTIPAERVLRPIADLAAELSRH